MRNKSTSGCVPGVGSVVGDNVAGVRDYCGVTGYLWREGSHVQDHTHLKGFYLSIKSVT